MKGNISLEISENGGFIIRSVKQLPSLDGSRINGSVNRVYTATGVEEALQIIREQLQSLMEA